MSRKMQPIDTGEMAKIAKLKSETKDDKFVDSSLASNYFKFISYEQDCYSNHSLFCSNNFLCQR